MKGGIFEKMDIGVFNMLFSPVLNALTLFAKKFDWKQLFIKEGQFILADAVKQEGVLSEKLKSLFSKDEMKKFARNSYKISPYGLLKFINSELNNKLEACKVNEAKRREFLLDFDIKVKALIKSSDPKIYDKIFINENIKNIEEGVLSIGEKVLEDKNPFYYGDTISKVEEKLRNTTKYGIDLNFFDYEEKELEDEVGKNIKENDIIYLKFRSREEGIYYVLRILKLLGTDFSEKVLVINNKSSWKRVIGYAKSLILIPNFTINTGEIEPAIGNKTIFIFGIEDFDNRKPSIMIPNRTKSNLISKLDMYIKDNNFTAHRIVEHTMGIFPALKRELFKGYSSKPEWMDDTYKVLIPALLLGSWFSNAGDKEIVEKLTGKNYEDYISSLTGYIERENAFLIRYNAFNGIKYRIAYLDEAWECLKGYITPKDLTEFSEVVTEVILNIDPIFDYEPKDQFMNSFSAGSGKFSSLLKEGIVKSLIMMQIMKNTIDANADDLKMYADENIKNILNSIKTEKQWFGIADLMQYLFEAAPSIFLDKISELIENRNSAFLNLFHKQGDCITTRNYYVQIIFALEKALFVKEYAFESIKILQMLNEQDIKYTLVNSPATVLQNVFCAFYHEIDISIPEKIELLEEYANQHREHCWPLIKYVLPKKMSSFYQPMTKPEYIDYDASQKIKSERDICDTYKKYYQIAFACAGDDLKKWGDLFSSCGFIDYGFKDEVITKIQNVLANEKNDELKYLFSKVVREYIYRCRYIGKDCQENCCLQEIEDNVFNKIIYTDSMYKYLYMFESGAFLDLHHTPQNGYEQEIDEKNKAQSQILEENRKNGYFDLKKLLERCKDDFQTGVNICSAVLDYAFDIDMFNFLYNIKKYAILEGCAWKLYIKNGLDYIISFYNSEDVRNLEQRLKFSLICHIKFSPKYIEFLDSISDKDKTYYWQNVSEYPAQDDKVLSELIIDRFIQYHNFYMAVTCAKFYDYPLIVYLKLLREIYGQEICKQLTLNADDIVMIFEKIYKFEISDEKTLSEIMNFEYLYIKAFTCMGNKKPKYLYQKLCNDPQVSAYFIKKLYKCDDYKEKAAEQEIATEQEKNAAEAAWYILEELKFCPCYDGDKGNIDEAMLLEWCKSFSEITKNNNQDKAGIMCLGKFLANSPKGKDGVWPCEAVREVIEIYHSDSFDNNFIVGVRNNRGVHFVSSGNEERTLAERYRSFADSLKIKYPHTSKILMRISNSYIKDSEQERTIATFE